MICGSSSASRSSGSSASCSATSPRARSSAPAELRVEAVWPSGDRPRLGRRRSPHPQRHPARHGQLLLRDVVVQATPPGWYPDPNDPYTQRYWDGLQWTENRSPALRRSWRSAGPPDERPGDRVDGARDPLVICGIGSVLALVFGYQAKREIEASGGTQGGEGMATAGIILGWIGVGLPSSTSSSGSSSLGGGLFSAARSRARDASRRRTPILIRR